MSRVLPILFNTEMVLAILREVNPKTATRRTIKGYIPDDAKFGYSALTPKGYISCRGTFDVGYGEKFFKLPCQKDDTLYIRETWCNANKEGAEPDYYYYADTFTCEDYDSAEWKWRPSIHMPKAAARIWIRVTDVRVERLQEMNFEDCLKEGAFVYLAADGLFNRDVVEPEAKRKFGELWDSTVRESDLAIYGWNANPWVWVTEFERCEKLEECGEEEKYEQ